ncbi:glycosyl transferase [Candidatus Woesebacteria bacterium RIFOXYA1_FULL_40_18]|uniref:Glycosyl transferase n=4 Tax=Candidatus Woeseibacteriota TaxID=1752722 RepID=A0A1F8CKN2_9BACT|nr:MAG: Dolichyl-phosphate mannose synthase related protein [Candidatus Woesebacteria bacterium GW2011_GWB1_40_101]OGM76656.1 MAG: glycosyl transferase [Candidatus Woesebacteria bacterium RIFOXYA1_FULL_40_18]OGM80926.1 MAG: glycosyl transferase [Candidatus Woesebacteria bacterium RIFOXYB1_FULL_40_26]OGM88020.1 MAG: glycosyl transferase [Candidatus Woesebacteria bacterium RIFOXYD1_FULL_40_21]
MKLSIIIPVYNEEETINEILKRVAKAKLPKGVEKEIVVVDDASEDKSKLKAQKSKLQLKIQNLRLLVHKTNQGKGAAVRTGIKSVTGDIILIQDADLEYDPDDYSRLIEPILLNYTEVVYGTRLKNYPLKIFGTRKTPFLTHYLGNKFLTFVTNLLYGDGLSDMETCYKVFTKSIAKRLKLKSNRFEFEPEITAKILKMGYKIYEVPIKIKPRGYEEGKKITWKDGFIALWTLIKYRFTD